MSQTSPEHHDKTNLKEFIDTLRQLFMSFDIEIQLIETRLTHRAATAYVTSVKQT